MITPPPPKTLIVSLYNSTSFYEWGHRQRLSAITPFQNISDPDFARTVRTPNTAANAATNPPPKTAANTAPAVTPDGGTSEPRRTLRHFKKTLIKEPVGNAQLFRLARRDLFSSRSGLFRPRLFQKKRSKSAKRNTSAFFINAKARAQCTGLCGIWAEETYFLASCCMASRTFSASFSSSCASRNFCCRFSIFLRATP